MQLTKRGNIHTYRSCGIWVSKNRFLSLFITAFYFSSERDGEIFSSHRFRYIQWGFPRDQVLPRNLRILLETRAGALGPVSAEPLTYGGEHQDPHKGSGCPCSPRASETTQLDGHFPPAFPGEPGWVRMGATLRFPGGRRQIEHSHSMPSGVGVTRSKAISIFKISNFNTLNIIRCFKLKS